jgi:FkbH-like protein
LDNTLWHGALIEDGLDNVSLNEAVLEVIKTLDQRGILNSIASKNNADDVSAALERFGISEFFVAPQSHWGPKSASIRRISEALNIGVDTLMFVDDSPFEREEVQSVNPSMTVLDTAECLAIPAMRQCQVEITAESASRRKMYQQAEVRKVVQGSFDGNYMAFLEKCEIVMRIRAMDEGSVQRVHELTQRTNQMNFSGNIYTRNRLREIMEDPNAHAYVVDCKDQFGSYGTVGFCLVDRREPRMTDLMFSCRIQSKRVEHAFLSYLVAKYRGGGASDFHADCKLTPRNTTAARVFEDLGFDVAARRNGVTSFVLRRHQTIPDERIVKVVADGREGADA